MGIIITNINDRHNDISTMGEEVARGFLQLFYQCYEKGWCDHRNKITLGNLERNINDCFPPPAPEINDNAEGHDSTHSGIVRSEQRVRSEQKGNKIPSR